MIVWIMMICSAFAIMVRSWPESAKSRQLILSLSSFHGYAQPETKHDAFVHAAEHEAHLPCIIVVNPFLDQNVGSVARSMLNFGHRGLRIVQPRCDFLSAQARALASGAEAILEHAQVYDSLQDCVRDLHFVLATSDRPRFFTQLVYTPREAAAQTITFRKQSQDNPKVGVVFGRERFGLYNEEIALANALVSIPSNKHFSSLNLAQAVNLLCYEMWSEYQVQRNQHPPGQWLQSKDNDRIANREELESYFRRLEKALDERRFAIDAPRREIVYSAIRNALLRERLTRTEVDIFHGILSSLLRPLPDRETKVETNIKIETKTETKTKSSGKTCIVTQQNTETS